MVPAMSSSNLSCAQDEKVKLRVSYGGAFIMDAAGKWSYRGGKNHVDTLSVSYKYGDVAFRWTEKVKGDLTGLKYQLPGEELEPDALITVSDDNDLQEMFEEYFRGLKLAAPTARTFHLRVFLFFDMIQEPLTPAEYADGCDFFRTSSGVERMRRETSGVEWDASSLGSGGSMESAGTNALHRLKNEQAKVAAAEVMKLHWEETVLEGLQRASCYTRGCLVPEHALDDSAFAPSSRSPSGPPTATPICEPPLQPGRGLLQTQDPWYVNAIDPVAPPGTAGALVTLAATPKKGAKTGNDALRADLSAYAPPPALSPLHLGKNPDSRTRSPANPVLLPSHISVFGEAEEAAAVMDGASTGGEAGVMLPSHISAFGGGADQEMLLYAARALVGAPEPPPVAVLNQALQNPFAHQAPTPGAMSMEQQQEYAGMHGAGSTPLEVTNSTSGGNAAWALFDNVHRVAKEDVKVLGRIGEGAFGEVSLATCAIFGKVAVKWLKPGKVEAHSASFWREADMLASLNHPNVLRFYGAVVASAEDPAVVGIMTEYMRGGSLSQFLTAAGGFIPLRLRAELALSAVNGLAYLHEMKVVHFDLKPDNLLLDGPLISHPGYAAPSVKVADFGLSKHKWSNYVSGVRDLRGTLPYMAPELVSDPDHVSEKADVWSLGMVLWEMLALRTPFQHLAPQQIIAGLMVGNLAPEVPAWCEPEWRGLMEACWEVNPACRPAFRDLAAQLERIIDATPPPPLLL